MTYAQQCEELIAAFPGALTYRPCKGKGLTVNVHPDGTTRKVMCMQHSRKAFMSGYRVDWDETDRVFGTGRPKGARYGEGMMH